MKSYISLFVSLELANNIMAYEFIDFHQQDMTSGDYYALFSDWRVMPDRRGSSYIIYGTDKKEGWKFYYKNTQLQRIDSPIGNSLQFNYQGDNLISIQKQGVCFVELSYTDAGQQANYLESITVNGITTTLSYIEQDVSILPDKIVEGETLQDLVFATPMLRSIQGANIAPQEISYDKCGSLTKITFGDDYRKYTIEHESLKEREKFLTTTDYKRQVVEGRLIKSSQYDYSYHFYDSKIVLTNRLGQKASYQYEDRKGVMKIKDFGGRETQIIAYRRFDVPYNGQIRKVVDPQGRDAQRFYYNKETGEVDGILSSDGIKMLYDRDERGNITTVSRQLPDGSVQDLQRFTYDQYDSPTSVTKLDEYGDDYSAANIERDDKSRVSSVQTPSGASARMSYNEFGRVLSIEDQLGNQTSYEYDDYNKLLSQVSPNGAIVRYHYNDLGALQSKKHYNADNELIASLEYCYDERGQYVSTKDHTGRSSRTQRNDKGQVSQQQLPDGSDIGYAYDALGRINQVTDQEGQKIKMEYNAFHKMAKRSTPAAQVSDYRYDAYGKLLEKVEKQGKQKITTKYQRDEWGRIKESNYATGDSQSYKRDVLGRVVESSTQDKQGKFSTKFSYDHFGRVTQKTQSLKAHGADKASQITYEYEYDKADRRTALKVTLPDKEELHYTWSYTPEGLLASKTENGITTAYKYDAAGRMVQEGTRTYTYGYRNKVMEVREAGVLIASMSYYPDGQLAEVKRADGQVEKFYWDGLALMKRGNTTYINEPAKTGGNPILADDTVLFNDMLGSTYATATEETSTPINRTQFGVNDALVKGQEKQEFFTGKPYVAELGYTFLHRNYRPELAKWQSADVVGYADGFNKFCYINNKVTMYADLFGASGILTIHSSSEGSSSSLNISGHSWISYTPDSTGITTTYGTWGNNPLNLGNGLLENVEQTFEMTSDVSRSMYINDDQESNLMNEIETKLAQGESAWTYRDPCSEDAIDLWGAGTGENLDTKGLDTPSDLEEIIRNKNGGVSHLLIPNISE